MPPVLKTTHPPTDTVDDYSLQYGYLGPALYAAVVKLRQTTTTTVTSLQSTSATGLTSRSAALPFPQVSLSHPVGLMHQTRHVHCVWKEVAPN